MNSQIAVDQINEQGHLTIGGVDIVELAQKYGTPLVVYDVDQIRRQIRAFKKVFEEENMALLLVMQVKLSQQSQCIKLLQKREHTLT